MDKLHLLVFGLGAFPAALAVLSLYMSGRAVSATRGAVLAADRAVIEAERLRALYP